MGLSLDLDVPVSMSISLLLSRVRLNCVFFGAINNLDLDCEFITLLSFSDTNRDFLKNALVFSACVGGPSTSIMF